MRSLWLDTGWGCGLVTVDDNGYICWPMAPIFHRLRGQLFDEVIERGRYRWEEIPEEKT